ncbi:MAG: hypothetical protein WDZ56_02055 [Candidatus Paceibacterota bacterium]
MKKTVNVILVALLTSVPMTIGVATAALGNGVGSCAVLSINTPAGTQLIGHAGPINFKGKLSPDQLRATAKSLGCNTDVKLNGSSASIQLPVPSEPVTWEFEKLFCIKGGGGYWFKANIKVVSNTAINMTKQYFLPAEHAAVKAYCPSR